VNSKGVFGYGTDLKAIQDLMEKPVKRDVELRDIKGIPMPFMKKKFHKEINHTRFVTIFGAAGESDIPEEKLKVMTDPYDNTTRNFFTDCVLSDPILSPSLDRRISSLYEDGFHLELEDASAKEQDNTTMTEGEKDKEIVEKSTQFDTILQELQTWVVDIHLLDNMKDMSAVSFAQGRAGTLITPPLQELGGKMPLSVDIIATEDLGEPIVDIGLTKQIVAINSDMDGKSILRTDEVVYVTRGKRGFRKDSKFYGTSPLEPILQISKAIKRIYNYDIPEAIIAAYITKVLFTIQDNGNPQSQKTRIQSFIDNFLTTGKLAFAMSDEVTKIDLIQPKVDVQMIDTLESKMADVEMSITGVPKSMLNREHNLNRDIATIEAIQYKRWVRNPEENLLASNYENQLLNPLFAIRAGKKLSEIPLRVRIVRNEPKGGDIDTIFTDNVSETKETEMDAESLSQKDATSTFGASGEYTITSEDGNKYHVSTDKTDS